MRYCLEQELCGTPNDTSRHLHYVTMVTRHSSIRVPILRGAAACTSLPMCCGTACQPALLHLATSRYYVFEVHQN